MKGKFCPQCGTEADPEFKYCPSCGAKIPDLQNQSAGKDFERTEEPEKPLEVEKPREPEEDVPESVEREIVCPTCGYRNQVTSRSCESCGTFLSGTRPVPKESQRIEEAPATERVESATPSPRPPQRKQPAKHSGKKENKQRAGRSAPAAGKKFHLETYQIASIAAAILLGAILVYGLMSSKPSGSSQGTSAGSSQQTSTTGGQPSADVLKEIDRLREVVDKDPADYESVLRLANMLQDNQMYDQGAIYYKRYLAKNAGNVNARVDYGVTLFEGGHPQEALAELKDALKRDPQHQIGWFNIAVVYMNLGEFDKANDALKKCVKIDSTSEIGKRAQQTLVEHANIGNQEVK